MLQQFSSEIMSNQSITTSARLFIAMLNCDITAVHHMVHGSTFLNILLQERDVRKCVKYLYAFRSI